MRRSTKLTGGVLAIAIAVVGGFEGLRTTAYRDVVGIPTICFGETRGVHMGDRRTVDECKAMLGDRLQEFAAGIDECLLYEKQIPDKTYVAMVSLAYNIGTRAFCRSSVAKLANAGKLLTACDAFRVWNKAGGKAVRGLTLRREEERKLCIDGVMGR